MAFTVDNNSPPSSVPIAPTTEERAFQLGQMVCQLRWQLLAQVASGSNADFDDLKASVGRMQAFLVALLPEKRGGEPWRLAAGFCESFHPLQSWEFAENFKRCFDLHGMVNPPEVIDAIQPLNQYLIRIADSLLGSITNELQAKASLARYLQLGVCVAEGIYPPAQIHTFFQIRESPKWRRLREQKKSLIRARSFSRPTESIAHDCASEPEPPEFELVVLKHNAGDLLPRDDWREEIQGLLAAVSFRDLQSLDLDIENCTPDERIQKVSKLVELINHHISDESIRQAEPSTSSLSWGESATRTVVQIVEPLEGIGPNPESHIVVAQSMAPSIGCELEFQVSVVQTPPAESLPTDEPVLEAPEAPYLDLIVDFERRTVARKGEAYAHLPPTSLSGDVIWPLFLALFEKAGEELSKQEIMRLPGENGPARRVIKGRINEELRPLDVAIPAGKVWVLIDVPKRKLKVARAQ